MPLINDYAFSSGGGIEINGFLQNYSMDDGLSINKGDFVGFTGGTVYTEGNIDSYEAGVGSDGNGNEWYPPYVEAMNSAIYMSKTATGSSHTTGFEYRFLTCWSGSGSLYAIAATHTDTTQQNFLRLTALNNTDNYFIGTKVSSYKPVSSTARIDTIKISDDCALIAYCAYSTSSSTNPKIYLKTMTLPSTEYAYITVSDDLITPLTGTKCKLVKLSSDKAVLVYDSGSEILASIINISGTSISMGVPTRIVNTSYPLFDVIRLADDKIYFLGANTSSCGGRPLTIVGDSISSNIWNDHTSSELSDILSKSSTETYRIKLSPTAYENKFIIAYCDTNNYVKCWVKDIDSDGYGTSTIIDTTSSSSTVPRVIQAFPLEDNYLYISCNKDSNLVESVITIDSNLLVNVKSSRSTSPGVNPERTYSTPIDNLRIFRAYRAYWSQHDASYNLVRESYAQGVSVHQLGYASALTATAYTSGNILGVCSSVDETTNSLVALVPSVMYKRYGTKAVYVDVPVVKDTTTSLSNWNTGVSILTTMYVFKNCTVSNGSLLLSGATSIASLSSPSGYYFPYPAQNSSSNVTTAQAIRISSKGTSSLKNTLSGKVVEVGSESQYSHETKDEAKPKDDLEVAVTHTIYYPDGGVHDDNLWYEIQ